MKRPPRAALICALYSSHPALQYTATHCNTLQHTEKTSKSSSKLRTLFKSLGRYTRPPHPGRRSRGGTLGVLGAPENVLWCNVCCNVRRSGHCSVCCSVCSSVLQCILVLCCGALGALGTLKMCCVGVCVLQCVCCSVCRTVLRCVALRPKVAPPIRDADCGVCSSVLQCISVCCAAAR